MILAYCVSLPVLGPALHQPLIDKAGCSFWHWPVVLYTIFPDICQQTYLFPLLGVHNETTMILAYCGRPFRHSPVVLDTIFPKFVNRPTSSHWLLSTMSPRWSWHIAYLSRCPGPHSTNPWLTRQDVHSDVCHLYSMQFSPLIHNLSSRRSGQRLPGVGTGSRNTLRLLTWIWWGLVQGWNVSVVVVFLCINIRQSPDLQSSLILTTNKIVKSIEKAIDGILIEWRIRQGHKTVQLCHSLTTGPGSSVGCASA